MGRLQLGEGYAALSSLSLLDGDNFGANAVPQ